MTYTITETDRVLAGMFTENTGRHFLDSGGAYGRNWERNQGREVEDFLARPAVTLDVRFGYLDVTLDAFHWLRDKLEYAPEMQRKFQLYVAMRDKPDDPWLVEMEEFAAAHKRKYGEGYLDGCVNTYNHESLLSQTLQYVIFQGDTYGTAYVALQVHGGCDVRGGYTAPKMFQILGDETSCLHDDADYTLYCEHEEPQDETLPGLERLRGEPHVLDYRHEWITWGRSYSVDPWKDEGMDMIHEPEDGEPFVRCPYCKDEPRPMSVGVNY